MEKRRWHYEPVQFSASRSTTFCHVSMCARLTRRSGLFFYSGCGESSRLIDFSWLHASMPGQTMSMLCITHLSIQKSGNGGRVSTPASFCAGIILGSAFRLLCHESDSAMRPPPAKGASPPGHSVVDGWRRDERTRGIPQSRASPPQVRRGWLLPNASDFRARVISPQRRVGLRQLTCDPLPSKPALLPGGLSCDNWDP